MKSSFRLLSLYTVLVYALSFTPTFGDQDDNYKLILHEYQGTVFNEGRLDPIKTAFATDQNNSIIGLYEIDSENGLIKGNLGGIEWESDFTLRCTWRDKYGSGLLRILFSNDYSEFRGFWGPGSEVLGGLYWDGVHTEKSKASLSVEDTILHFAEKQQKGLNGATLEVLSAYTYRGTSWIEPLDIATLVAIEITVKDFGPGLDLDDIEILNGETGESYGSDPDVKFLDESLNVVAWEPGYAGKYGEHHVLLIYAFPKGLKSFGLRYWGIEFKSNELVIHDNQAHRLNVRFDAN